MKLPSLNLKAFSEVDILRKSITNHSTVEVKKVLIQMNQSRNFLLEFVVKNLID